MTAVRRGLTALGVVAVAIGALLGGNTFGLRDSLFGSATPAPRPVAVSPFVPVKSTGKRETTVLRSQPWWQGVASLSGARGTTIRTVSVDGAATQWRARWSCQTGRMTVRAVGRATPLIDKLCPGSGTATATRTGRTQLSISAGGAWTVRIDQQVDVPLVEPPLVAMTAPGAARISTGTFYRIDQAGIGRADIYRLPGGEQAMRLTRFYVSPNVDLEIRLSPLPAPHTTRQFLSARSALVAPLDITAGSLNFRVPHAVDPSRYRSVVIWCPLINSAYAAAALKPVR